MSLPGFDIETTQRDIASASRLIRMRPALSLLMCAELPGGFPEHSYDLAIFYLVMPFGRNGSPANFAIFGDAISCMNAQFGTDRPGWFFLVPFLSEFYVGKGSLFDIRHEIRPHANAITWESITVGLLGSKALNLNNLEEEGACRHIHTVLGFGIDSESLRITLPEAKIAGDLVLFDQLEKNGALALEVVTIQQIRGHIEHFRASNAIWEFLTGPIDFPPLHRRESHVVEFPCPRVAGFVLERPVYDSPHLGTRPPVGKDASMEFVATVDA